MADTDGEARVSTRHRRHHHPVDDRSMVAVHNRARTDGAPLRSRPVEPAVDHVHDSLEADAAVAVATVRISGLTPRPTSAPGHQQGEPERPPQQPHSHGSKYESPVTTGPPILQT